MQFKFIEIPGLPRLAWCARIKDGQETVKVIHGPGVEVHDDWFFEGAWDGPFDGPGFVEATDCTGTGARLHGDTVEFVSPTQNYRGLLTLKTAEGIFVANSIPFILAQAAYSPDINYIDYYRDLHFNIMNGFVQKPRPLVMRNGSHVYLHIYCNIVFGKDGLQKLQKSAPEEPSSFEDYRDRLVAMLVRLKENATDPRRDKQVYQPMTTLSRGYDSVACSALGAAAGWKDAVTMVPADPTVANNEDDGTPVA